MPYPRGPEVTERDGHILVWITRHGVVTPDQVARHFFTRADGTVGTSACYRRLRKLEEIRLVRWDRTFWREATVLRVTGAGARMSDIGIGAARLVLPELRHALGLVDLTEQLVAANAGATLLTEREIRAQRYRERRTGERRAGQEGRIPDGLLTLHSGETVALELDRQSKRAKDYARIIEAYAAERFDKVWWYVSTERIAARLRELVAEKRAARFIDVRVWDGAPH
ncbi:MAG: replication-relaxation family protein [Acidimicrobiales bacterium]